MGGAKPADADSRARPGRGGVTMRRFAFVLSAIAIGAALGWGTAQCVIASGAAIGGVDNDGWRTSAAIGAASAGPYTRAVVAHAGLLALNRQEALYYTRALDEAARPFEPHCVYRIEGGALAARWWSITLYAEDRYLARNDQDRHSVDATGVHADESGAWTVRVAPERNDASNWISTQHAGAFSLSLRLYEPNEDVFADLASARLPRVVRQSCRQEA